MLRLSRMNIMDRLSCMDAAKTADKTQENRYCRLVKVNTQE